MAEHSDPTPAALRETMMTELRFYGSSDDLCEVEGKVKGADEYDNCANRNGLHAFAFIVRQREADIGLRVNAFYDGSWSFAVGMLMEDAPLPWWPIRTEPCPDCAYSTQLVLTVPADVEVVRDSLDY